MILIKKILVPIDLSDISLCAVGYASCLAKQTQAEILATVSRSIQALSVQTIFLATFASAVRLPVG